MIVPTITLHGTDKRTLLDDYERAQWALAGALTHLTRTAPHPRDYRENEYQRALNEHIEQVKTLKKILDDLTQVHQEVCDQ